MSEIMQGTTPTIVFHIDPEDLDISSVVALKLVFKQGSGSKEYKIVKSLEDCDIFPVENLVSYKFKERETLGFDPKQSVSYQFRFRLGNDDILGTKKRTFGVEEWIDAEVTFDGERYRRNCEDC